MGKINLGVLIFNKKLYKNMIPDNPGGGTVSYTNPWGGHDYFDDVETQYPANEIRDGDPGPADNESGLNNEDAIASLGHSQTANFHKQEQHTPPHRKAWSWPKK